MRTSTLFSIAAFLPILAPLVVSAAAPPAAGSFASSVAVPKSVHVSKIPMTIEEVTASSVCGTTLGPTKERVCYGVRSGGITTRDTVSEFKEFIAGEGNYCANDERGLQCWASKATFQKPLKEILAGGIANRARFYRDRVCLPYTDNTVHCFQAEAEKWVSEKGQYTREIPAEETYGPYADLKAFGMAEENICFLAGDQITCEVFRSSNQKANEIHVLLPKKFPKGMREMWVDWGKICTLNDSGLTCYAGRTEADHKVYQYGPEWIGARGLVGPFYNVCAISKKDTLLCAKYDSSGFETTLSIQAAPELAKATVKLLVMKADGDTLCARYTDSAIGSEPLTNCWSFGLINTVPKSFTTATDFVVTVRGTCLNIPMVSPTNTSRATSTIQCYKSNYTLMSPLPNDTSPVQSAGNCTWNKMRFQCEGIAYNDNDVTFKDIKTVIATSPVSGDETPCIVYEDAKRVRRARCVGSQANRLNDSPPEVAADVSRITTTANFACLYGGTSTKCWGDPLGGQKTPNLNTVSNMYFGNDFGCANDAFGFLCWGRDVAARGLKAPRELTDIEAVLDFAVTQDSACAVNRSRRLKCWGTGNNGETLPPDLFEVNSIGASRGSSATYCASSQAGVHCWGYRDGVLDPTGAGTTGRAPTSIVGGNP